MSSDILKPLPEDEQPCPACGGAGETNEDEFCLACQGYGVLNRYDFWQWINSTPVPEAGEA